MKDLEKGCKRSREKWSKISEVLKITEKTNNWYWNTKLRQVNTEEKNIDNIKEGIECGQIQALYIEKKTTNPNREW